MSTALSGYRLFTAPTPVTIDDLTGGWRAAGACVPPGATCVGTRPAAITIFLSMTAFII